MTNAQIYLDQNYPKEERGEIGELNIAKRGLTGHLDLRDFSNLKILQCYSNQLTSLDISQCSQLEQICCENNKIEQDLAIFSHLKNLQVLALGYVNSKSLYTKKSELDLLLRVTVKFEGELNNKFHGSLAALKNCSNLKIVSIAGQKNITGSLTDLPTEKLNLFLCHFTFFAEQLKPFNYDVKA